MVQIRTDMGTVGSAGDLGSPAQAAAMTAEVTTALTAEPATAPAGGTGATAGAYDTAANRNTMITCVQDTRTRVGELDTLQLKILTRLKEVEDMLENIGLVAKN